MIDAASCSATTVVLASCLLLPAQDPALSDAQFEPLHALIKRQPGESRWMEIDWYPSVWEGRQKAAETGKPIFLMAGSGGAPSTGC